MSSLPRLVSLGADCSIELLFKDKMFLGLGAVRAGSQELRSSKRPMFVEIRNPSGIELFNYSLIDRLETPEKTALKFSMDRREGGLMEWMVHEIRSRYNTADWSESARIAEDTTLELELRPVTREIGGRKFSGFSYRYHYRSGTIPIYKILDRGTWEIGGSSLANEFWMRNCFAPPILQVESTEQFYSTEWYMPACANPNIFQFLPLQVELQGFTFTASKEGLLVTWVNEVAHVRSLFEKPRGKDLLVHLHEHCGDLSHEFSTAPVEVLWSAGERDRVDLANDYDAIRELVYETLHSQIGMRRERITTNGFIEEWEFPDLERYRQLGLPKLIEAGVKTLSIPSMFENNMNTWGVGNMCCTVDFKIAESIGTDKFRAFCQDAREAGITVEMWGNPSLSALAIVFNRRNGPGGRIDFLPQENSVMATIDLKSGIVRNASNAMDSDHYAPELVGLNLRDEAVRKYWLRCWKIAHDDFGLGAIFRDSSFNMAADKFHYIQNTESEGLGATSDQAHLLGNHRPEHEAPQAIHSQYHAHLSLMVEMQAIGYVYSNEDLGVFGTHRHGPALPARLGNLSLWSDCLTSFDPAGVKAAGYDSDDVYFRGLAYRMMWSLFWDIKRDVLSFRYQGVKDDHDVPSAWHLDLLRAYNRVEDLMRDRTILPAETGVLYRFKNQQVLWAFEDFVLPLENPATVIDVLEEKQIETSTLKASRRRIYIISAR
jgi:hypothetical protein